jgi:hypothetical protein
MKFKTAKALMCRRFYQACLFSVFLSIVPLRAQDLQEKITVDDVSRNFLVHLPKGYDAQPECRRYGAA